MRGSISLRSVSIFSGADHHEMSLKLEHYLPLLERKHRGLDRAVPVRQFLADVDPIWRAVLAELRRAHGEVRGGQAFVAILQLCPHYGLSRVEKALSDSMRQEEFTVETVRYFLWDTAEKDQPEYGPMKYAGPVVEQAKLSDYDKLHAAGKVIHV